MAEDRLCDPPTLRCSSRVFRFWDGPARACPHRPVPQVKVPQNGELRTRLSLVLVTEVHQLRRALPLGARGRRRRRRRATKAEFLCFWPFLARENARFASEEKSLWKAAPEERGKGGGPQPLLAAFFVLSLFTRRLPFRLASARRGDGPDRESLPASAASLKLLWQCNEPTQ